MAAVTRDVIPYGLVKGNSAYLTGLNVVGLRRRGFSRSEIKDLRSAYRLLFAPEGTFKERIEDVEKLFGEQQLVGEILGFIKTQEKRNICLPEKNG